MGKHTKRSNPIPRRSREPESPMNRRAYRNKQKQPCGKK